MRYCGAMTTRPRPAAPPPAGRTRTGRALGAALAAAAVLASACTAGGSPAAGDPPTGTSAASEPAAPPAATVSPPDTPVAVAAGSSPAAVSVAVSRQLFDSAPAVVVAAATDPAGIADGAGQAERIGAPLLLDDGTGTAVRAEIDRLQPRTVLAVGPDVPGRLQGGAAEVVTDGGELTGAPPADGLADVAVLVRAGPDAAGKAAVAAATATGKAAGATVVPVATADPRADPDAIEALAAAKPAHVLAAGSGFGAVDRLRARLAVAATGTQLPGGGQVMFPGRRLVAMYGHPGTAGLGVLGEQPVDAAIARAKQLAAPYRPLSGSTPVVPAFEIIASVATGPPGPDGNYSFEAPISLLKPWVDKAGEAGVYVVLDLQPGRTDFLTQAKRYEPLLKLPHVGLALDPEWRLKPGQQHLTQIGSVSAAEVNSVYRWLADLTAQGQAAAEGAGAAPVPAGHDRRRPAAAAGPGRGGAAHPHGRAGADRQQGRTPGGRSSGRRRRASPSAGRTSTTRTPRCSPRRRRCCASRPR